jgi:osmotically inducible protein OsmC
MVTRQSDATWEGNLRDGEGTMTVGEDYYTGEFTFVSRFEEGDATKTNPEELVGAAHAGCFSMALSNELDQAGHTPERVHTVATVHLEEGTITRVDLETEAEVPDIDDDEFQEIADGAKENCPVSRLLAAAEITLDARLV